MYELHRDLLEAEPPFLIVYGDGRWRVAAEVFRYREGIGFIEPFAVDPDPEHPSGVIPGTPWHAGDDVWEMEYSTQIMTLDHPHYHRHPAWQLWLHWLLQQRTTPPAHAH